MTETPKKGHMSIYSTDLYRGVIVPVFGNESIGRVVRAGGFSQQTAASLPAQPIFSLLLSILELSDTQSL